MRQLLTQNLGWKLLSLLLAVGLWLAIAREPEVATSLSVPVEFKNMREDLDISGNLPDRVFLELRGPSGRLRATISPRWRWCWTFPTPSPASAPITFAAAI